MSTPETTAADQAPPGASSTRIGVVNQFIRFGLSGGFSAIFDFSTTMGLTALGLNPDLARMLGFVVGTTIAYLINRRWTFNGKRDAREIVLTAITYTATFVLMSLLNWGTRQLLPASMSLMWAEAIAWFVSQGISSTANFVAQRRLVFRH